MDSGEILDAGCDWITATTKQVNQSASLSLWASQVFKHQRAVGNVPRAWGMAGFSGFACGQIQLGMRGDEFMVRLSGQLAQSNWKELYKRSESITRFDVQVTHRDNRDPRRRIRTHYRQALSHSSKMKRGPYVTLITGNDGSDTLYLGRRTSNVYGRVYNKGVESGDPHFARAVRFEVEFKDNLAMLVARDMAYAGGFVPYAVARTKTFLESRGLSSTFLGDPLSRIRVSSTPTDLERKLEWLRKSCRKSIHAILEKNMGDQLLAALGLEVFDGILCRASEVAAMDHHKSEGD